MNRRLRRALRPALKLRLLWHYRRAAVVRPRESLHYLARGREVTNFTYEIANLDELADFVVAALSVPRAHVERWLEEVAADTELRRALADRLGTRSDREDVPRFGRRLGWYCVLRALRPALAVETGTHDGLGTALLLRALERNDAEGAPGRLLTFDVDPDAGWLVPDALRSRLETWTGDVRETLPRALAGRRVGFFLHDSLHEYEHERFEFAVAIEHADERLAVLSDNAHDSPSLEDVAAELAVPYHRFDERPVGHFYPGAAIGMLVYDTAATASAT